MTINIAFLNLFQQEPNIDIWQANLSISGEEKKQYWALLNEEEKQRANRFVKGEDQTRFIAGRGILRSLLSNYIHVSPENIKFDYLPHGKPILASHHCQPQLQFNVSHSHDLALYIISESDKTVGIDVELMRPLPQALSLAQRFLTARETAYLASLSPNQQSLKFFQFWTAKEAYLKATGEGLTGLQSIELIVSPTDSKQCEIIRGEKSIQLYSFSPQEDYIAAIARQQIE